MKEAFECSSSDLERELEGVEVNDLNSLKPHVVETNYLRSYSASDCGCECEEYECGCDDYCSRHCDCDEVVSHRGFRETCKCQSNNDCYMDYCDRDFKDSR